MARRSTPSLTAMSATRSRFNQPSRDCPRCTFQLHTVNRAVVPAAAAPKGTVEIATGSTALGTAGA